MAYIQGNTATGVEGAAVVSLAFSSPNGIDSCLIVATQSFGGPGILSDSQGNSYTQIISTQYDTDWFTVWVATGCPPGSNTVSFTGAGVLVALIAEYSGVQTAAPMDDYDESAPGSDVDPAEVSVTTIEDADLLVLVGGRHYGAPGTALSQSGTYTHRLGNTIISGGTPRELGLWDTIAGAAGTYTNQLTATITAPLITGLLVALKAGDLAPIAQRGNIDYDQVRLSVRHANGPQFQMFDGGTSPEGHVPVFDAAGNLTDAGGPPVVVVGIPGDGDVPVWDESAGEWVPGDGGGSGGGGRFLVFVNDEGISTDWTMTVNDTWPPFSVNGVGV